MEERNITITLRNVQNMMEGREETTKMSEAYIGIIRTNYQPLIKITNLPPEGLKKAVTTTQKVSSPNNEDITETVSSARQNQHDDNANNDCSIIKVKRAVNNLVAEELAIEAEDDADSFLTITASVSHETNDDSTKDTNIPPASNASSELKGSPKPSIEMEVNHRPLTWHHQMPDEVTLPPDKPSEEPRPRDGVINVETEDSKESASTEELAPDKKETEARPKHEVSLESHTHLSSSSRKRGLTRAQSNTVQYSRVIIQYSTVQNSTVQYNTI